MVCRVYIKSFHFSAVHFQGKYALGECMHERRHNAGLCLLSTPSFRNVPSVAFEIVLLMVPLTIALSR